MKIKIRKTSRDQYRITIPKQLAESLEISTQDHWELTLDNLNKLTLIRTEKAEE